MRLLLLFGLLGPITFPSLAFPEDEKTENAAQADQLAYSNTLGSSAVAFGAATMVADDMTMTGSGGCELARYEFDVSGNADGQGDGPFAVDFELFDGCAGTGGLPIPGTQGHVSFPNNNAYTVTLPIPGNVHVVIPRTVWLAVTFDRDHAGWVGGAPALVGYSDDWLFYPVFGCEYSFGGYPASPHGSMNARLYVRGSCPPVHAAYHAKTPRRGPFSPGAGLRMADDITLDGTCQMVAYEVTVRGTSTYSMDLRLAGTGGLPGQTIADTARSIQHFGSFVRTLREDFNPPIPLPPNFWFTVAAPSTIGRTLVCGLPARIGSSNPGYAVLNGETWESREFPDTFANGALEVTILCAGPAVMGACCDMHYLDSEGEAVCREVTRANCPYPAPGSDLLPSWRVGDSCVPDPFSPPCGTAACCRANGSCTNNTQNFCGPRGVSWTRGSYCGSPEIACEAMCVLTEESCSLPHTSPGCINPFCCAEVCSISGQGFCCQVAWDAGCASQAALACGLPPSNDECFGVGNGAGARLVSTSSNTDADLINSTGNASDPGFCCHSNGAGKRGVGTVWFRFVATSPTARVRTCLSNAPASDSLLQIFEAGDPATPESACATLRSIGCSDDAAGCSGGGLNSQMCMRNLTVGRTYYVMLAAKNDESRGLYRLSISTACSDAAPPKCDCASGIVQWLEPPSGVVDARRPHARADAAALEGISSFLVQAPLGSDQKNCWNLCETAGAAAPNGVAAATYLEAGRYSITLNRPITPGAVTAMMLNGDPATRGVFYSHPANVNADTTSGPGDLLDLIDALNGVRFLPWGIRSGDIDRSGSFTPVDILETIDLLNGADAFTSWNGVAHPDPSPCNGGP